MQLQRLLGSAVVGVALLLGSCSESPAPRVATTAPSGASPALPTASQSTVASSAAPSVPPRPTTGPAPTQPPTTGPAPTQQAMERFYLWPITLPTDLAIDPQMSTFTETGFVLYLRDPANPQNDVTISSDPSFAATSERGDRVTVRGQSGRSFSTGAGGNVTWLEGEQWVRVSGGMKDAQELILLAESLQALDKADWLARLQGR